MTSPASPDPGTAPAPAAPLLPGGSTEELAALSYEQARAALDRVVEQLEASSLDLERSLDLWERGNALADICQEHLEGARRRIEAARPDLQGQAATGF